MEDKPYKALEDPFINKEIAKQYQNVKQEGALQNLKMAVKDMIAIKGHKNSFGNPLWLDTHPEEDFTAPAIQLLIDAGAQFQGMTHMADLCFDTSATNVNYGTPLNYAAPDRVPGGSSSGSASAVSAKISDFAILTDSGGSARIPTAYCGIFAIKPTYGRISTKGFIKVSEPLDTFGWGAYNPEILQKVGAVLFQNDPKAEPRKETNFQKIIIPQEFLSICSEDVQEIFKKFVQDSKEKLQNEGFQIEYQNIGEELDVPDCTSWFMQHYFSILGYGMLRNYQPWYSKQKKEDFGQVTLECFELIETLSKEGHDSSLIEQKRLQERVNKFLGQNNVILMPTMPFGPPKIGTYMGVKNQSGFLIMILSALAGLVGVPQIQMPLTYGKEGPIGISIIAGEGLDEKLLQLSKNLSKLLSLKQLEQN